MIITDDEQINCRFDLAFYYYLVLYYTNCLYHSSDKIAKCEFTSLSWFEIHIQTTWNITYVLCKSNSNEFRQNSWLFVAFRRNFAWNDISTNFPCIFVTPIVLICAIFRMIIHFARWFTPNFWVIKDAITWYFSSISMSVFATT